jgi:sulfate adenylyltransferase subunit 2
MERTVVTNRPTHLDRLESEAIHILREAVAEARNPVMLFSAGKDSTVMAHLALRAFYPAKPPFPLLHVDSTWEFRSLIAFRDAFAREHGFQLIAHSNEAGRAAGINPFDHGDRYTTIMRTDPLKTALDEGGYDIIFGGARRDEETSRAKERVVSVRNEAHAWEPRQQRPELWQLYNLRLGKGQSARVFPISNWTEADIWAYALRRGIELAPLYSAERLPVVERGGAYIVVDSARVFPISNWTEADIWAYALRRGIELAPLYSAERLPVVERGGAYIVVDDESRMRFEPGETVQMRSVRFRTLGCWPVTGAIASEATNLAAVALETMGTSVSERQGRISDGEDGGSLEQKKREGYF